MTPRTHYRLLALAFGLGGCVFLVGAFVITPGQVVTASVFFCCAYLFASGANSLR